MRFTSLSALAASVSTVAAFSQGFNYGSTKTDGSFNYEADFVSLFNAAKSLPGTNGGYTSARLYTMIQGGSSTNEPTQAIPAAIKTGTTLLLGMWASGGEGDFQAEMTALQSAISQYGDDFAKQVVGISVGSEDLYRNSPMGMIADQGTTAGNGADATTVAAYVAQLKAYTATVPSLKNVPIGHVDTWTAWAQSTDSNLTALIQGCDWIGVDAYPYFQGTMANDISLGAGLFADALQATQNVVGSKEIWITETGWPVSGKTVNQAVPSTANAKTYYDAVGCPRFGNVNIYWFTLDDSIPTTPNPSFGLVAGNNLNTPLYDLSCAGVSTSTSSASSSAASTPSSSGSSSPASSGSATQSGSGTGSGTGSGSVSGSGSASTMSTSTQTGPTFIANPTGSSTQTGISAAGSSTIVSTPTGSSNGTVSQSGSGASTSPTGVHSNGAGIVSGSIFGAVSAMIIAVLAL